MADQASISDHEPSAGKPVDGMDCEWCGDPATVKVERERKIRSGFVKTATYIYACEEHKHIAYAERIIHKRR